MVQKGSYPFWFDDVPNDMSRAQYKRLIQSKPKNKSMKVWIKENKKNMKKYTKKIKKKSSGTKNIRKYKKKRTRTRGVPRSRKRLIHSRRMVQKGGYCAPCLIPPLVSAMGLGTAGYFATRSSSEKIVNGKQKEVKRKDIYKLKKNGKKLKKIFTQNGLNLKLAGQKVKASSLKDAENKYKEAVKKCIQSGFKKC
tara:strand:- start:2780 stop:3364 length:585 start_codon:yes stop_codon:yes gene_type:complete